MFKFNRNKYGMKTRAIEETRKELACIFSNPDMWRVVDDQDHDHVIVAGSLRACLEHILQEREGTLEGGAYVHDEESDATAWEHKDSWSGACYDDGYYSYNDILEKIEEHAYQYEWTYEHVGNTIEDFSHVLETALKQMRQDGTIDTIMVGYVDASGGYVDAFEIEREDVGFGDGNYWSRSGNPKPALIEKIEGMELETWK